MARLARVVLPGYPHHITQRGNRRQDVFFQDSDYENYLELLKEWCDSEGIIIWAYCLMTNHVHLIVVPKKRSNLGKAIGETHRRYTRMINFREGWRGHLWQGRFASFPLDNDHLLAAARYIERNPVAAGMVEHPWDYPWSSARAHIEGRDNILVRVKPLLEMVDDWRDFISLETTKEMVRTFHRHEHTGRPLGDKAFVERLEAATGRELMRKKPGPKRAES